MNKFNIKHVIIFGSDAFGSYLLQKQALPTLNKLMKIGAYSLKSRSVIPIFSVVNWTSIISGMSPNFHGYTQWNSSEPEITPVILTPEFKKFPSLFYLLKTQKPQTTTCAFFRWSQWTKMIECDLLDHWYNLLMVGDNKKWDGATTHSIYTTETDNYLVNEEVVTNAITYIKTNKPTLSLIYVNEPDTTGHYIGHDTPEIMKGVQKIDQWVAKVINMIENDITMKNNTLFIFCADHGGLGQGDDCHGNFNLAECQVPLIFYGAMVKPIGELKEAIIQYDLAKTLAFIFNLNIPNYANGQIILSPFTNDETLYEREI